MRRLLAFLIEMLPLDSGARRALEETFADWQHEASLAHSSLARAGVAATGLFAIACVLGRTAAADLSRPVTARTTLDTIGLGLLMGLAFSVVSQLSLWRFAPSPEAAAILTAVVTLLPTALVVSLPFAALTPIVRRGNSRSLLGAGLALTLVAAANVAWVAPKANQQFRRTILEATPYLQPFPATPRALEQQLQLSKGLAELTVIELLERESGRGRDQRVAQTLHARMAYVLMVPICLLLGTQARRLAGARGWRSGRLVAWSATALAWGGAAYGGRLAYGVLRDAAPTVSAQLLVYQSWLAPLAVTLATILLALAARRPPKTGRNTESIAHA